MSNTWREAGYTNREFSRFFQSIKRKEVFMYSVNHPKLTAVIEYAKCIALKYDQDLDFSKRDVVILDGLISNIWPVYPEVAAELGVRGNYFWRFGDSVEFEGPRALVDFAYERYRAQGIEPHDLVPVGSTANIDDVLKAQL